MFVFVCVCVLCVMCLSPGAVRNCTHAAIMVGCIHHISILMAWQASVRNESSATKGHARLYISKDQNTYKYAMMHTLAGKFHKVPCTQNSTIINASSRWTFHILQTKPLCHHNQIASADQQYEWSNQTIAFHGHCMTDKDIFNMLHAKYFCRNIFVG